MPASPAWWVSVLGGIAWPLGGHLAVWQAGGTGKTHMAKAMARHAGVADPGPAG
jgi:MoxR-like ATPase